jgi:hypothetical protein
VYLTICFLVLEVFQLDPPKQSREGVDRGLIAVIFVKVVDVELEGFNRHLAIGLRNEGHC